MFAVRHVVAQKCGILSKVMTSALVLRRMWWPPQTSSNEVQSVLPRTVIIYRVEQYLQVSHVVEAAAAAGLSIEQQASTFARSLWFVNDGCFSS